jgi:Cu+-exporting ATPase
MNDEHTHPAPAVKHDCCGGHDHHRSDVKPLIGGNARCVRAWSRTSAGRLSKVRHGPGAQSSLGKAAATTIYTCPMHPEVEQDQPGLPKMRHDAGTEVGSAAAEDDENAELHDMTRRFWIGAAADVAGVSPGDGPLAPQRGTVLGRRPRFALASVRPHHARGLVGGLAVFSTRLALSGDASLNMFTLIAIGVGAAYLFSAVGMLMPDLFPATMRHQGKVDIYFEAAAVIVVLVLLGQVLELRARSRTGSAIKALLNLAPPTARQVDPRRATTKSRSTRCGSATGCAWSPATRCRWMARSSKAAPAWRNP